MKLYIRNIYKVKNVYLKKIKYVIVSFYNEKFYHLNYKKVS